MGRFSILDFSKDGSENYSKFMERTLLRYKAQKIHIERLKLDLFISDYFSAAHVNEWIRIAIENGVRKIALVFNFPMLGSNEYTLPRSMFEANSLRELSLRLSSSFRLEKQVDERVTFNRLRTLKLYWIRSLDDDMFHYIMSRSPLIENLCVEYCESLKRIKVSTLYSLKSFYVACIVKHLDLEIEAPNLQYLHCDLVRSLQLYNTEKLIHLALLGDIDLSPTFLEHKFLQLEKLNLSALKGVTRIDISSHSLKYLGLNAKELREININAPNLVSLELYHINLFPNLSLSNTQSLKIFAYRCPKDEAKPIQSKISLELDEAVDEEKIQIFLKITMS